MRRDGLSVGGLCSIALILMVAWCAGIDPADGPQPGKARSLDIGGGVRMEFAWIPPGAFVMGSPATEHGDSDEGPQHTVTISKGFWMGKHEVTQAQWAAVVSSGVGSERGGGNNPSHFKRAGGNAPVEQVSWDDCQGFLKRLNARSRQIAEAAGSHLVFTLPTEAEWEYACRAGTTTPVHYGPSLDATMANFEGIHLCGNGQKGACRETTVPVGSYAPNAWGLYDMHGNVWEWCVDVYDRKYYKNGPASDPQGPASGRERVVRGGSWRTHAWRFRSAYRYRLRSDHRRNTVGFRVLVRPQELCGQ